MSNGPDEPLDMTTINLMIQVQRQGRLYIPPSPEPSQDSHAEDADPSANERPLDGTNQKEDNHPKSSVDAANSANNPSTVPKRECTACGDQAPVDNITVLECRHKYCRTCLQALFNNAISGNSAFPPRCCSPISLNIARFVLTPDLIKRYAKKKIELDTPAEHRIYCYALGCSALIHPSLVDDDVAICPECGKATCMDCKGPAHANHCPIDDGMNELLKTAEKRGWKRCWNCKRMVERRSGCDHMTCVCGKQFCYRCGGRYPTCECTEEFPEPQDAQNADIPALSAYRYQPVNREQHQTRMNPAPPGRIRPLEEQTQQPGDYIPRVDADEPGFAGPDAASGRVRERAPYDLYYLEILGPRRRENVNANTSETIADMRQTRPDTPAQGQRNAILFGTRTAPTDAPVNGTQNQGAAVARRAPTPRRPTGAVKDAPTSNPNRRAAKASAATQNSLVARRAARDSASARVRARLAERQRAELDVPQGQVLPGNRRAPARGRQDARQEVSRDVTAAAATGVPGMRRCLRSRPKPTQRYVP
ncbi:hypothetical protein BDW62DRAFT_203838 [Aspergillus aurantiobrunneus]